MTSSRRGYLRCASIRARIQNEILRELAFAQLCSLASRQIECRIERVPGRSCTWRTSRTLGFLGAFVGPPHRGTSLRAPSGTRPNFLRLFFFSVPRRPGPFSMVAVVVTRVVVADTRQAAGRILREAANTLARHIRVVLLLQQDAVCPPLGLRRIRSGLEAVLQVAVWFRDCLRRHTLRNPDTFGKRRLATRIIPDPRRRRILASAATSGRKVHPQVSVAGRALTS